MRWAVVLAGGVGSRFWPVSTSSRPKQLIALSGDRPLVAETVERILPLVPGCRVLIVTSRGLAEAVRKTVPEIPAENILAEPFAASTAPALAWATALAARQDPQASVLSLHADWTVADSASFRRTADAALDAAERLDVLVTVGVRPTRPETGYGYIVPGERLGDGPARAFGRFVEKPTAERAAALVAEGALWNTGLFAWTAKRLRTELETHTPEIAGALSALDRSDVDGFYDGVRPVSVDVGVFERTTRGATLTGDFGWDDVGSWAALSRVRAPDADGNVASGDAHAVETKDSVLWADEGAVVTFGVEGLVVVRAGGVTLVTTREKAADLKTLLARLPERLTGERGV